MSEMSRYLDKIAAGEHLAAEEAGRVFQIIMAGGATPAQIAALLMGLRRNGETVEEISGAALAIRNKAKRFPAPEEMRHQIVDTCGTGGDGKGTYNISTAVAIVTAACGAPVVKHGNRAVSSRSGSADVLAALGVNIEADEEASLRALREAGICFLLAPLYHAAMRHVGPVRQELGIRTIFNIIGPLVNPALPERQLLGVYSRDLLEPVALALDRLGASRAWIVHGSDGMDEITLTGETYVAELKDGQVRHFTIRPEDFGVASAPLEKMEGRDAVHNAQALRCVLKGAEGPYRDAVLVNTAAALVVAGIAPDIHFGMKEAALAIADGRALATLAKLVEVTNAI